MSFEIQTGPKDRRCYDHQRYWVSKASLHTNTTKPKGSFCTFYFGFYVFQGKNKCEGKIMWSSQIPIVTSRKYCMQCGLVYWKDDREVSKEKEQNFKWMPLQRFLKTHGTKEDVQDHPASQNTTITMLVLFFQSSFLCIYMYILTLLGLYCLMHIFF